MMFFCLFLVCFIDIPCQYQSTNSAVTGERASYLEWIPQDQPNKSGPNILTFFLDNDRKCEYIHFLKHKYFHLSGCGMEKMCGLDWAVDLNYW